MKAKRIFTYKPSLSVAIFCIVSLSAGFLLGQTAPAPTWVTDDWSQHHLVFSNPGTVTNAVSAGTLAHWSSITSDLRYQIQQRKRSGTQQAAAATPGWVVATPTPIPTAKGKLTKDWSVGLGGVAATLTGIVGALNSGSISGSSTLTVDSVVFDASPPTAATSTGTFTGNPTNGQTVTIGGSEILTASLSTPASQTGTFSSPPTSGSAITVGNGSSTLTLTTNATAATDTGTFGGPPLAATGITITNPTGPNTLTLTTNATAAQAIGTFGGAPTSTTAPTITVTNSAPTTPNVLTLTTNATAATDAGTFAGPPLAATGITITNPTGPNTLTLTTNATAAQAIGAFNSVPTSTTAPTITVTNSAPATPNVLTLATNATAATDTGTFAGPPLTTTAITIINPTGPNTLQLTTNATVAQVIGTVSSSPTSASAPSITITNSAGATSNTLTLTTNATAATATGTFSSTGPTAGQTITITNGLNSNALTLTGGNGGTGTITVSGRPGSSDTLTIGTQGYTFASSCGSTPFCIYRPSSYTNTQYAYNIAAAITATSSLCSSGTGGPCYGTGTTALANVTAAVTTSGSNGVVTITNYTGAALMWSESSSALALSPASSILAGTANSCTSATAGTFLINPTAATGVAANLQSAINACVGSYSAVGVTSSVAGAVVTIADTTVGSYPALTLGGTASNFLWSGVTAGSAGTNGCTSATTGTFAGDNSAGIAINNIASNLSTAINACNTSNTAVGVTASYSTGNTFTVTSTTPGPFLSVGGSSLGTIFSWGSVTGGLAGTPTCITSTSGTYVTSNNTTTLAGNLVTTINACPIAAGVTATSSGAVVTITDRTLGLAASFTVGGGAIGIFTWSGSGVTNGSNGTKTCTGSAPTFTGTFVYDPSTSNLASNAQQAIAACPAALGITASYTSGNTFTAATSTPGPFLAVSGSSLGTIFSWGSVTGGLAGTPTCTTSTSGTYVTSNNTTTLAGNLVTTINACPIAAGVTATSSGAVVTITDRTLGLAASFTVGGGAIGIFTWSGSGVTNGSNGTKTCTGSAPTFTGTFVYDPSTSNLASNAQQAIAACPAALGITASYTSGNTFTAATPTPGPFLAVSGSSLGTIFSWGSVTGGSAGTSACTTSTSGTYVTSNNTTTLAQNLATTINACPVAAGVTATSSGAVVTITDRTLGLAASFTVGGGASGIFTWSGSGVTNGSNGTKTCTGPAPTFTGTFVYDPSTANLATNLSAAINACPAGTGLTNTSTPSGSSVTVTASTWGTSGVSLSPTSGFFAWNAGTLTGGTNGTNTGNSFAIDNVNADAATNLAAAITRNGGTVGVTATSAGAVVTVTAATAGTGGNSIGLAETLSNFGWTGSTLANGTDGTTSGTSTPPTFAYWTVNTYLTSAQVAANIANAINTNTTLQSSTGVGAGANAPASGDVTVTANVVGTAANTYAVAPGSFSAFTGGTLSGGSNPPTGGKVQPNTYPAKFSFSTSSADCTNDFVVYPTGATGATGVATIAAYNNIYTGGCSGQVPATYWSYNTGTNDAATTSPIISFDNTGSQIAFIQGTSTAASLVLLKWAANTSGTLTNQTSAANYRTCTAPCMYTLALSGSHPDTLSSPFYDYHGDAIYVGDDSGNLHQFTGVFNGSPTENTTSPWPVNLGSAKLSSPVYDGTWNAVFVGDLGGALHCVTSSTGACQNSPTSLGGGWYTNSVTNPSSGGQIADAPLVDSTANYLLAFVNSTTSNTVYGYGEQYFPTSPGSVGVGTGLTNYYLYAGTFDNVYYQSSNHTGNIYVVGNTGATTGATLYKLSMVDNGGGGGELSGGASVVTGLTASGAHPWPSPVTEFCNGACTVSGGVTTSPSVDYIFFSVNRGTVSGCTNTAGFGCILSYTVSNPSSIAQAGSGLNEPTTAATGASCWWTGGIVIDNSSTLTGASQIYFANLLGNIAGGPTGATSSSCTAGPSATINAVQAAQSNP